MASRRSARSLHSLPGFNSMCLDSMAPISLTEDGQGTTLQERNYMGLSDCPSFESTLTPNSSLKKELLNIKATELRLGLPGSQSPIRDSNFCLSSHSKLDEKLLFPLSPMKDTVFSPSLKNIISGNKRGFTDAILASRSSSNVEIKTSPVEDQLVGLPPRVLQDRTHNRNESNHNQIVPPIKNNSLNSPASKAQVVGWPPIRSFRKNTLATSSKINEEADGGPYSGVLFVKVSMDGAPYLRKVDLRTYSSYLELSSGLEKMFSGCNLGQCGPHGVGRDMLSEGKVKDLLHGSEYALTYEDKDGDWMLVGDVPWEMFVDSCQRMRIMKSSDAIGLAPRATEKCDPAP